MHRNTFFLVAFLAIFAALVIGINVGKKLNPSGNSLPSSTPPTPSETASNPVVYDNSLCGLTFQYPSSLTKTENASGSAVFSDGESGQVAVVTCQADIPRPALGESSIETLRIVNDAATASVSAKIYHDSSAKDGTPVDIIIWRKPKTTLDVYIAGYGNTFNQIIQTLHLIP